MRASLPHATVRLFRLVNRTHGRALEAIGLSAEQAHVLTVLWAFGPQTVGELGKALALSSPTLTGALDRLAAQRLIRRRPSDDDGRAYVIESRASATLRRRALRCLERTEAACFGALTRTERRELLRLMTKATAALEGATPPRRRHGSR
ncbi:MAG TPA: MarR family transcriptional regulator [Kofleriaceae bacterium]|nr:MarR family transcriptional regulator [Kofleriaceae bacterium]